MKYWFFLVNPAFNLGNEVQYSFKNEYKVVCVQWQHTLISTNTARLIYRSKAPLRTVLYILAWDSAQDDLLIRTVLQDEDLLPNDNAVNAKVSSQARSKSTESSLFHPFSSSKGGCRRTQQKSVATNAFPWTSSEQLPWAAPAEENQKNHRTAMRATIEVTRYSSSREGGSSSIAFGIDSPAVHENTGWLRAVSEQAQNGQGSPKHLYPATCKPQFLSSHVKLAAGHLYECRKLDSWLHEYTSHLKKQCWKPRQWSLTAAAGIRLEILTN